MERRRYRQQSGKAVGKWHSIAVKDVNALFAKAGWIGQRRAPVSYIKSSPLWEKSTMNAGKADGR